MFTGIIAYVGIIKDIEVKKNLLVLSIAIGPLAKNVRVGDSVSVNGVCLTAVAKKSKVISFDVMKETITATSLRFLHRGDRVNCELALEAQSRVGGHFVTGHVDATASIKAITQEKNWVAIRIGMRPVLRRYLVPKGSVTLDGISLTVGKVGKDYFDVYLIPHTLKATTLGSKKIGDALNLETDILAKYLYS